MPSIVISNSQAKRADVDELPDRCPWCHNRCIAVQVDAKKVNLIPRGEIEHVVQAIFQCPSGSCGQLFIANYAFSRFLAHDRGLNSETLLLQSVTPNGIDYLDIKFPESIRNLSERFCRVYIQASAAQSIDLEEVAGPGYRKAFEILIRDYLISIEPDKKDAILKMELGNCIANKVTDDNLKICAERAAWLGNDEVHYTRVFTQHDVDDLKDLIQLAMNWVDSSLRTQHFKTNLQKAAKEKQPPKTK